MSPSTQLSLVGTEPDPRELAEARARRVARRAEAALRAKRRRRRRRILLVAAGLIVLAAGWLSYRAYQIRSSLQSARSLMVAARSQLLEGNSAAGAMVAQAQSDTHTALAAGSDPLWSIVGHIPVVGTSFRNATALAQVSDDLAQQALPLLVDTGGDLTRIHSATAARLPVASLADLAGPLTTVENHLGADAYALTHLPTPGELAPVDTARTQLLAAVRSLQGDVSTAAAAARIGPGMLGADGPRRYLVAFENPAEARPDGGNLGAFAEVVATRGHIRVVRVGPNSDLPRLTAPPRSLDTGFRASYGPYGAGSDWVTTNLSPDFSQDADAWAAMYRKGTGRRIDGVIGLDPTALGDLAAVTGTDVSVPGYGSVKPQQLASFIESGEYATRLSRAQRQGAMASAGRQVLHRMLGADVPVRQILATLGRDAGEGHLHLASVRTREQAEIAAFPIAGTVPATTRPYAGVYVTNVAGSKLDYYLHEQVAYRAPMCRANGTGTVTVRLTNDAPSHGLSPYVTERADMPRPRPPAGENRDAVTVLATQGSRWTSATLDGRRIALPGSSGVPGPVVTAGDVAGHPSLTLDLEMPVHATRTLRFQMVQPASAESPLLQHQALFTPVTATTSGGC